MTGIGASTSLPPLPRWFGPRASPDDPAVSALIALVGDGIHQAESAMTAAEAWWSRRAELCRSPAGRARGLEFSAELRLH